MEPNQLAVFGIRNCDTIKKTLKWLEANGVAFQFHDYKKLGVPEDELNRWIQEAGAEALINKRGTTWRKLTEADKAACDDPGKAAELLRAHSSMIKRPIITKGQQLLIGFDEELLEHFK